MVLATVWQSTLGVVVAGVAPGVQIVLPEMRASRSMLLFAQIPYA